MISVVKVFFLPPLFAVPGGRRGRLRQPYVGLLITETRDGEKTDAEHVIFVVCTTDDEVGTKMRWAAGPRLAWT